MKKKSQVFYGREIWVLLNVITEKYDSMEMPIRKTKTKKFDRLKLSTCIKSKCRTGE